MAARSIPDYKDEILRRFHDGQSMRQIGKALNLDFSTVGKWVKRWVGDIDLHDVATKRAMGQRVAISVETPEAVKEATPKGIPDPEPGIDPSTVSTRKRFVVTSALNNCDINESFFKSLLTFCEVENAQLLVIPVAYKNISLFSGAYEPEWPSVLEPYFVTGDVELSSNICIMGSMRIQATAARPLQGTFGISKGRSAIFGHPRLALETVPTPMSKMPLVYMTTGSVSIPEYSNTKAGRLGEFHHDQAAAIVETDGQKFWWRHVHPDKFGNFIDIDAQYGPNGFVGVPPAAEALILGDVHVDFDNKSVIDALMSDLAATTHVRNIVLHDLLDFFSGSHHHAANNVLRVLKAARGRHSVYGELRRVAGWLDKHCSPETRYHIIRSNHHDHLDKWLNNNSAQIDAENLWLWHHLNAVQMKEALDIAHCPDSQHKWGVTSAFELAMRALCQPGTVNRFSFADDKSPLEFAGIDCSNHGDKGPNGSRGSRATFAKAQRKTFIGHSHSPGIHDGCYQVGKSSSGEAYLSGYSSHLHCSGIIYGDGNRTLFPVIDGRAHLKGVV
ncbi:MAG TPA: helix-turn-helix domain-containing protein [Dongiaceae bacterium]|nr:helix-turn-helix domain-containing protein [Dongiaceae bacterium]